MRSEDLFRLIKKKNTPRPDINFISWYTINYNPGHNISEVFNKLVQVRIAITKPTLDIYYNKLGTPVPSSRVAEQLKTYDLRKLGNIRKMPNFGGVIA